MLSGSVAKRMYKLLPHIKLIFILREPVSTLLSYIKFKPGVSTQSFSVESFISTIRDSKLNPVEPDDETGRINNLKRLQAGCYAAGLQEFLNYYPRNQIGIFFYDELSEDTRSLMEKVCNFIEIDASFYSDFQFKVENKTRSYKYPRLHRYVAKINLKWEPFLNRYPSIRNGIRRIYHLISEAPEEELAVSESDMQQLKRYYASFNKQLCSLLQQNYRDLTLPSWLTGA